MPRPLFVDLTSALAVFFVCMLAQQGFLYLPIPPVAGAGIGLLVGLLFFMRYAAAGGDAAQQERRARSRLRPLGAHWPWAILSAVAVAIALLAAVNLYAQILPPPADPNNIVDDYLKQPFGWLPFAVMLVVVSPLIQETVFRGWIQGRLSEEFGPELAIVNAAVLGAVARLDAWHAPYLLLLGLASGYTVFLTRSVWSGVLMNAAFYAVNYLVEWLYPAADQMGARATAGVIVISLLLAVGAWHRERIIHDRTAAAEADAAAPTD